MIYYGQKIIVKPKSEFWKGEYAVKISGTIFSIKGKDYISPIGYPKFAFDFDEDRKKYAIANTETEDVTDYFVDELIYSSVPLETWTANFVVVRIGEKYYLCDNNGNCYYENEEPYMVCRNLFVFKQYIINEKLEKRVNENYTTIKRGGFSFAFEKRGEYLLTSEGKISFVDLVNGREYVELKYFQPSFETMSNWIITYGNCLVFINKDFKHCFKMNSRNDSANLIGKKSQTFQTKNEKLLYSSYFNDYVQKFELIGNVEIVEHNKQTYFFKPNGEIELVSGIISKPRELDDEFIIYRKGLRVVIRDMSGNWVKEEEISPKEAYQFLLAEKTVPKK